MLNAIGVHQSGPRAFVSAIVVATVLTLGIPVANADTQAGHQNRAFVASLGCSSGIPNVNLPKRSTYDFHGACVWHDLCYQSYGYGSTPTRKAWGPYPKAWCDRGFYKKMAYGGERGTVAASTKGCYHRKGLSRGPCLSTARLFYVVVRDWPKVKPHPTKGRWARLFCRGGCMNVPDMIGVKDWPWRGNKPF